MHIQQYRHEFGGAIRVCLNWDRLTSQPCPIKQREFSLADASHLLYAPWYVDDGGRIVGYSSNGARPLSVSEAASSQTVLDYYKVDLFEQSPARLTAPSYYVGDGRSLLLDGNHRAVAGVAGGHRITLVVVELHGPRSEDVLPDLKHWT